jgi:heat-inducible transcriptional repressor
MDRKHLILAYIIEEFIRKSKPLSSNILTEKENLQVSSATIRNEMANLEKEGLIKKPHTSAGRIPTSKGYKYFVKNIMNISEEKKEALKDSFLKKQEKYFLAKTKERVYDGLSILTQLTDNVAVATIPKNKKTLFLGISNFLKQKDFSENLNSATNVIEILEQGFFEKTKDLDVKNEIEIYIGKNHFFPQIQSCSFLCVKYTHLNFSGILGIVGPIRMDYAKNKILLEQTKLFIEGQKLLN